MPSPSAIAARLRQPTRLAASVWLIYLGPLAAGVIFYLSQTQSVSDFAATIYDPGRAVLAGHSPYPPAELSALVGQRTFVYPPTLLAFDVPLALLPFDVARIAWTVTCAAGLAGALRVLDVRDPRCYALALLSVPAIQGIALGNVTVLLVLLLALGWRCRDKPVAGGAAIGLLLALKLLLWPLFVWLLVTRRFRSTVVGAVVGATSVFGAWALIGFKGMTDYPQLLHFVGSDTAGPRSLTVMTLAHSAGLPDVVARGSQWTLALVLLALAVWVSGRRDGDRRAFSVVIVAALVVTPVMWLHYFLFLLVPIALLNRRFGPAWAVPWAFWLIVWLPQGRTHFVFDGAHNLGPFGLVPTVPRLLLMLGLIGVTLALTAGAGASRSARPRSRRTRGTVRTRSLPSEQHVPAGRTAQPQQATG